MDDESQMKRPSQRLSVKNVFKPRECTKKQLLETNWKWKLFNVSKTAAVAITTTKFSQMIDWHWTGANGKERPSSIGHANHWGK